MKYNIHLAEGQRFEVPIAMEEYIKLRNGFNEVYVLQLIMDIQKKNGCIPHIKKVVYEDITSIIIRNPLAYPGEMDLTTHIHWDELKKCLACKV